MNRREFCLAASASFLAAAFPSIASGADRKMRTEKLIIRSKNSSWTAELEDNAAVRALIQKLPLDLPFQDLYGRELCYRFPDALPTDGVRNRGYQVGEIIYWPPRHSFVIMYAQNGEEFDMQSIGRITGNLPELAGIGDGVLHLELRK